MHFFLVVSLDFHFPSSSYPLFCPSLFPSSLTFPSTVVPFIVSPALPSFIPPSLSPSSSYLLTFPSTLGFNPYLHFAFTSFFVL
ncbi:uncharacterized protein F5891DRAFT_1203612 [Suillus fuscotomentosus]|uniref:Uncharacterized protein n=1 Tax=Suillus fuscotomentosus TaxID=1912939 RepID=A0AAD4HBJ4_9AGAM|nr:uncharacterized protein F5891DRAFT_1203612 [Suillus fuscotomentosus]KAG1883201.1 hypothetical protein F5891DRAFT_1203612 [Suillus fuscotomentosus]